MHSRIAIMKPWQRVADGYFRVAVAAVCCIAAAAVSHAAESAGRAAGKLTLREKKRLAQASPL
jgi:hypothetical protein